MAVNTRNSIVTNGLVLALDAGNTKSLPAPPSTNLMVQSQNFTSANWLKVRSSVTASVTTAPDGTLTGTRLVNDTSNNTHYVRSDGYTFTAGETYTISYYAKSAELSWIGLQINEANVIFPITYTNLASGSLGSVGSGTTATIQAVGNGWYRTSVTRTVVNPGLSYFTIITSTGNGISSYLGDGTSGVFIWGVQLERLPFSTPYIPTTTTSVSRNTWFDISGNNNSGSLINGPTFSSDNGGCIVFDGVNDYVDNIGSTSDFSFIQNTGIFTISSWVRLTDLSSARYFLGNNDGTTGAKGFYLGYYGTSGRLWLSATSGVSGQPMLSYISSNSFFTNNEWIHIICVGNGTTSQFYKNGVSFGSPSSNFGTFSTGDSTQNLSIGRINNFNSSYWIGSIAQTSIYNRALSSLEILQNYNATKTRFGL